MTKLCYHNKENPLVYVAALLHINNYSQHFGIRNLSLILEIVITRAASAFHKLFMVMGCVFDTNTVLKTVEKLTFQAFY